MNKCKPFIGYHDPETCVDMQIDIAGISAEEFAQRAIKMADAITEQRAKGWTEFHPETYCHRCGGKNVRSWFVASDRFNVAVEALGLTVTAIICPGCFVEGHEKATGLQASWELTPATPFRPKEAQ